jgi:hypothetical protein
MSKIVVGGFRWWLRMEHCPRPEGIAFQLNQWPTRGTPKEDFNQSKRFYRRQGYYVYHVPRRGNLR